MDALCLMTRRDVVGGVAASAASSLASPSLAKSGARIVVIGGGFGGASCARALKKLEPKLEVTLIEQSRTFTACPFSNEVIAVTVVVDDGDGDTRARSLGDQWAAWDPGVPLRILRTDYASVVEPILGFIDDLREKDDKQVVVLIPVVIPDKARYRLLHNQIDLVLSRALRDRPDVVVARVRFSLQDLADELGTTTDGH